ncbi:mitochondrial distribution and morphology proteins-domain-containing protein [Mycena leptocephala]|nr:mitochondrial distribution and morphology proteins-domain-containing protein [Mycena leptocephala]
MSMPHLPRPSRDDFPRSATGFWPRANPIQMVHDQVLSAVQCRRHLGLYYLVRHEPDALNIRGDDDFFSVIFATANSLSLQQYIARAISNYLTAETDATIIVESAIVPKWKIRGFIQKRVYLASPVDAPPLPNTRLTEKLCASRIPPRRRRRGRDTVDQSSNEDTNCTMFDLNAASIDVPLSLWRWLDGKGLIQDAVIKGTGGLCTGIPTTLSIPHRSGTLRAQGLCARVAPAGGCPDDGVGRRIWI